MARGHCVYSHVVTWTQCLPLYVRHPVTHGHPWTQRLVTECTAVAWSRAETVPGRRVCSCHGNAPRCFCALAGSLRGLLAPVVPSSPVFLIQGSALLSRSRGLGVRSPETCPFSVVTQGEESLQVSPGLEDSLAGDYWEIL